MLNRVGNRLGLMLSHKCIDYTFSHNLCLNQEVKQDSSVAHAFNFCTGGGRLRGISVNLRPV